MNKKIQEKIKKEIKRNKQGFTASELSRNLNISRNTISINIAFLLGKDKLIVRNVGIAKLYSWKIK